MLSGDVLFQMEKNKRFEGILCTHPSLVDSVRESMEQHGNKKMNFLGDKPKG